jgi:hypothetical protein
MTIDEKLDILLLQHVDEIGQKIYERYLELEADRLYRPFIPMCDNKHIIPTHDPLSKNRNYPIYDNINI